MGEDGLTRGGGSCRWLERHKGLLHMVAKGVEGMREIVGECSGNHGAMTVAVARLVLWR